MLLHHLEDHDSDVSPLGYAGQLTVGLASTPSERNACRCLLAGGRGLARLPEFSIGTLLAAAALSDDDREYLAVWDNLRDRLVAVAALRRCRKTGHLAGFDLGAHFELRTLLRTRGPATAEVSHLTVDPSYRDDGRTVRLLLKGLASWMNLNEVSTLLAPVTVSRRHGDSYLYALLDDVRRASDGREAVQLRPWVRLPQADDVVVCRCRAPSALKYLLRLGAYVHPEPAWDAVNNAATFAVVLDRERIERKKWARLLRL